MRWRVAYHEGDRVIMRGSDAWAWGALPAVNVLWVDLVWGSEPWRQRLQGRDNYWLDVRSGAFGMYPDPENANRDPRRAGEIVTAWRYDESGSHPISPPDKDYLDLHVLSGVLLPDAAWEEVTRAYPLVLA